jgi:hypothetical protein
MKKELKCGKVPMESIRKAVLVIGLIAFTTMSDAKAATVVYGFDQISNLFTSSSLSAELSPGSYFAFGSFYSTFDATTITSANILSTLRDSSKWFKAFETATLTGEDQTYEVTGTAGTADGMYAYAVLINDTVANVQAAIAGSATGISKNFGVFTYVNTNPSLRFDLPRDPADFGGDNSSFSNEVGLGAGFNNFAAVGNLGVVTSTAVALVSAIPEPSSAKLLLVAALLVLPWMRRTAKEHKI